MGAFSEIAEALWELGLAPTPTGGADGKSALLKGHLKNPLGPAAIRKLAAKFPDANVGLVTGLSGLVVVDIDEAELLEPMLRRFGETPLIVKTGSGHFQAYYRETPGVTASDLRYSEGVPIEIKARGTIVIAPPSVNFETGGKYECYKGRFDDETLAALPRLNPESLRPPAAAGANAGGTAVVGRNVELFRLCLAHARQVETFEALLKYAHARNAEFETPLDEAEVVKTAKSAWKYQQEGRNFSGAGGHVVLNRQQIDRFCEDPGNPIALALRLRLEHGARVRRGETFCIARRGMAKAGTLPGWSEKQIRTAKERSVERGWIIEVQTPSGAPAQYTFPERAGPNTGPNVIKHPSPLLSAALQKKKARGP